MKYCKSIELLQFLHFPFNKIKDIKGILSNHLIEFLHFGQDDRPRTTPLFSGRRYIQTFAKLPQRLPNTMKAR